MHRINVFPFRSTVISAKWPFIGIVALTVAALPSEKLTVEILAERVKGSEAVPCVRVTNLTSPEVPVGAEFTMEGSGLKVMPLATRFAPMFQVVAGATVPLDAYRIVSMLLFPVEAVPGRLVAITLIPSVVIPVTARFEVESIASPVTGLEIVAQVSAPVNVNRRIPSVKSAATKA
jgi:hypothetical protein